jgi:hypothetical protein
VGFTNSTQKPKEPTNQLLQNQKWGLPYSKDHQKKLRSGVTPPTPKLKRKSLKPEVG